MTCAGSGIYNTPSDLTDYAQDAFLNTSHAIATLAEQGSILQWRLQWATVRHCLVCSMLVGAVR
jgi:hypothetical protein